MIRSSRYFLPGEKLDPGPASDTTSIAGDGKASLETVMVRFSGTIALLALVLAPSAALAQIDLSGSWGARYHEDFAERIPGPELANFLGLPINESARQWALDRKSTRLNSSH